MKKIVVLLYSTILSQHIFSQALITPVKIGEEIPEIVFKNVLNYTKEELRLSDFRGKLLILDMWATTCATCINTFPKMEALQAKYKDFVQIFLINPYLSKIESTERIKKTLSDFQKRSGLTLSVPIPIHDTILLHYFPHIVVPHQIWIGSDLKVVAITGWTEANEKNIENYLKTGSIDVPEKDDWSFDNTKPLLENSNGGDLKDVIYRSTLTNYLNISTFTSGVRFNNENKVTGYFLINHSLLQLIREAYKREMLAFPQSRIVYDVKDSSMFKVDNSPNNLYCYDLIVPPIYENQVQDQVFTDFLQSDLKKYFNISVRKERKTFTCFIIKDGQFKHPSKLQKTSIELSRRSKLKYYHNVPVSRIITNYYDRSNNALIIDETVNKFNIDLDFPSGTNTIDIYMVVSLLREKGFLINQEEREMDALIITDKK